LSRNLSKKHDLCFHSRCPRVLKAEVGAQIKNFKAQAQKNRKGANSARKNRINKA